MIIFMITCGGIALLNCVLLAFEAYLDYSVKMAAIAATTITITTITTTATTITIAANHHRRQFFVWGLVLGVVNFFY
ncbi:hypothetical protein Trisim1_005236 [Trichoderma cf. simile WF8]